MQEKILEIAEKYTNKDLNVDHYLDLEEMVENGETENAKLLLLGYMWETFNRGEVTELEFNEDVEALEFSDELKRDISVIIPHLFRKK